MGALALMLGLVPGQVASAMRPVADDELAAISGEGIVIALEDFRFSFANNGYIEQVGVAPAAGAGFKRGDLRWYGFTLSGAGAADGKGWTSENCGHLLCPVANTGALVSPYDNPYLFRVFDQTGWDFQNASVTRTVFELVAPTDSDPYRWAFWGELEVGKVNSTTRDGLLQSQAMIVGKPMAPNQPAAVDATNNPGRGPVLRLMQQQDDADRTLAFNYHSRLSGNFRFSLAQTISSANALGSVPLFDNGTTEANAPGLIFRNVFAHLPLGQMFYQSLIFDDTQPGGGGGAGNGNFVIELTRIPNQSNAYTDFYSTPGASCTDARYTGVNCGYQRTSRPARYFETHGYARWGDWYPGNGANCGAAGTLCNTPTATNDGILFNKATAAGTFTASATRPDTTANQNNDPPILTYNRTGLSSVNLGDSRITGLLIQHLKITSLGAGP